MFKRTSRLQIKAIRCEFTEEIAVQRRSSFLLRLSKKQTKFSTSCWHEQIKTYLFKCSTLQLVHILLVDAKRLDASGTLWYFTLINTSLLTQFSNILVPWPRWLTHSLVSCSKMVPFLERYGDKESKTIRDILWRIERRVVLAIVACLLILLQYHDQSSEGLDPANLGKEWNKERLNAKARKQLETDFGGGLVCCVSNKRWRYTRTRKTEADKLSIYKRL